MAAVKIRLVTGRWFSLMAWISWTGNAIFNEIKGSVATLEILTPMLPVKPLGNQTSRAQGSRTLEPFPSIIDYVNYG
jgi:hypothetical protein